MADLQFINFACSDPDDLSEFWSAALDGDRQKLPELGNSVLVDLPDDRPSLLFREAPRGTDSDLPIHLDLHVEDRTAEIERLEDLGGSVRETKTVETGAYDHTWTVMEDPEGNGFCISEHS